MNLVYLLSPLILVAIILSSVSLSLIFFIHLVIIFHVVLLMYYHWTVVVDSALIFKEFLSPHVVEVGR